MHVLDSKGHKKRCISLDPQALIWKVAREMHNNSFLSAAFDPKSFGTCSSSSENKPNQAKL